jgi:transcriptional regulator with XRE-family HTH domain
LSYIRFLRKKNHLTQTQLAEILGVTQTSVSQWESGRNFPDIKTARKMAEYFDTTLDQIMSAPNEDSYAVRRGGNLYGDKLEGGLALNDVFDLEIKRKLMIIVDHLSLTAKVRLLERAEAYLDVESAADQPLPDNGDAEESVECDEPDETEAEAGAESEE